MEQPMKARSSSRGWLTRASKVLEELTHKEGVTDVELSNSLSEFYNRLHNVDEIQAKIETDIDQSMLDENIDEGFSYRQKHCAIKNKAETLVQILRQDKDKVLDQSRCSSGQSNSFPNLLGHARLPQLELPTFSGNYLEFSSFYDTCIAVVDGSDLPAVTKFTYLQSLLTGEALASIKDLSVTEESYPVAKEILEQRLWRKERIIFVHIHKLLTLQVDFRKSNGLWGLYDSLQAHVRCLTTLGVSGITYDVILTPLILREGIWLPLTLAKARVAPLKRVNLPRLELLAAVLGARMKRFVQISLNLSSQVEYRCYTDSMITLHWIQSDANRWKTFVANRMQEIQDLTDPSCWSLCAGADNPADLLTRGIGVQKLLTSSLWLCGPVWLSNDDVVRKSQTVTEVNNGDAESEERQAAQCVLMDTQPKVTLVEMDRFSSCNIIGSATLYRPLSY